MLLSLLLLTALAGTSTIGEFCDTEETETGIQKGKLSFEHMKYDSVYVDDSGGSRTIVAGTKHDSVRSFDRAYLRLFAIYGRANFNTPSGTIWIGGRENFPHYAVSAYMNDMLVTQVLFECEGRKW